MTRPTSRTPVIVAAVGVLLLGLLVGRVTAPNAATARPTTPVVTRTLPPTNTPTSTVVSEPISEGVNPDAGDASPDQTPHSQPDETRRQWEPVVLGFARNFVRTDASDNRAWAARLAPLTTAAVQNQLAEVDPRNIPAGRYLDSQLLSSDGDQLVVKVIYTEGWALALYLIDDGEDWHVYQYDRYEE